MVQEVLSEKTLHLVLLFLLLHQWLHCLLFHPLKKMYFKMLRSETGTQCTELLNLCEISEFGKGKHLLEMFLIALSSCGIWDEKGCLLYWGYKAHSGQGLGEVGLGGGTKNASVAVFCYSAQQNLVQCCSWRQRESWRKNKRLALCFPPSPRKKQSKIDINWTAIWKYVTKWAEQGWGCVAGGQKRHHEIANTWNCMSCFAWLIIS